MTHLNQKIPLQLFQSTDWRVEFTFLYSVSLVTASSTM